MDSVADLARQPAVRAALDWFRKGFKFAPPLSESWAMMGANETSSGF
jgi:hypothetical protein